MIKIWIAACLLKRFAYLCMNSIACSLLSDSMSLDSARSIIICTLMWQCFLTPVIQFLHNCYHAKPQLWSYHKACLLTDESSIAFLRNASSYRKEHEWLQEETRGIFAKNISSYQRKTTVFAYFR